MAEAASEEDVVAQRRKELLANETPEQRKKREVAMAKRMVGRAPRGGGFRSEQKVAARGKGFAKKGSRLKYDRLPKPGDNCGCGSDLSYSQCCSTYHSSLSCDAPNPSALVRARYTAFRYRLPDFLMATTDPEGDEFQADASAWKKDLLQFCDTMEFQGLTVETEEADAEPPTVEFRATFAQKGTLKLVDACEKSEFIRREGKWLYTRGKVTYDTPRS